MLNAEESLLVIIDVQGNLADAVCDRENLLGNINRLAEAASCLNVPTLTTEQLPDKLGKTREELSDALAQTLVISKSSFGCCGEPRFIEALTESGKKQIILCGIETHICVLQTAIQLLKNGFEVFLVADAVSSRNPTNKHLALERARQYGAEIVVTESVLFEWMRDANHPEFRNIRKLLA